MLSLANSKQPQGEIMKVEKMTWITREDLRANPDKIFLFGDNLERVGMGGQAGAMRGEPNAYGIPTKKTPAMNDDAFFTDEQYAFNCSKLFASFAGLKRLLDDDGGYAAVVIPVDGLGTGLAELDKRAPKTFAYLEDRVAELDA